MLSLQKPTVDLISRFLTSQAKLDFSYPAVGATAGTTPAGYVVDHTRIKLGEGESDFLAAKAALQRWEQFRLGWVDVWSPKTPIQAGEVVAVMGHAGGFWWSNACRIVYVVDESKPIRKYGFAYGTLPDHIQSGEERFLIEWDQVENSVWYDVLAFSRPNQLLIRLGYSLVRRKQKQFGRDSAAAMLNAVRSSDKVGADRVSLCSNTGSGK